MNIRQYLGVPLIALYTIGLVKYSAYEFKKLGRMIRTDIRVTPQQISGRLEGIAQNSIQKPVENH